MTNTTQYLFSHVKLIFHLSVSTEDPEAAHREKSPVPEEEAGTAGEMQHCPETEDWIAVEQPPEYITPMLYLNVVRRVIKHISDHTDTLKFSYETLGTPT